VRILIDGVTVFEKWKSLDKKTFVDRIEIASGSHQVTIEYFEHEWDASLSVSYAPSSWTAYSYGILKW
jgi:hypothetical protein